MELTATYQLNFSKLYCCTTLVKVTVGFVLFLRPPFWNDFYFSRASTEKERVPAAPLLIGVVPKDKILPTLTQHCQPKPGKRDCKNHLHTRRHEDHKSHV
jgi:hypothetical protein